MIMKVSHVFHYHEEPTDKTKPKFSTLFFRKGDAKKRATLLEKALGKPAPKWKRYARAFPEKWVTTTHSAVYTITKVKIHGKPKTHNK